MTAGTKIIFDRGRLDPISGWYLVNKLTKYWAGSDDNANKNAYNPWTCTFILEGSTLLERKDPFGNVLGYFGHEPSASFPALSGEVDVIGLVNSVHEATTGGVNFIISTAEATETVAALAEKITALRSFIKNMKRGKFGFALSRYRQTLNPTVAQEISGRWLEANFGWLPLMKEIETILAQLRDITVPAATQSVVVEQKGKTRSKTGSFWFDPIVTDVTNRASTLYNVEYNTPSYSFNRGFDVPDFPFTLYDAFIDKGFPGILDPKVQEDFSLFFEQTLEGVWNILPFSFVIDWFIPVGDYLTAQRVWGNMEINRITYTRKLTQKLQTEITPLGLLLGWDIKDLTVNPRKTQYSRGIMPSLTLSAPRWNSDYRSFTHVAHSAALITQLLPTRRKRSALASVRH